MWLVVLSFFFFFQAEDGIRDLTVTGVQTCALPISEIAMRLTTGVLGTPMPSFIDSVEKPDDIWHLANYLASLGPESPHYATLLTAEAVNGDIPADPVAEFWKRMAPQNIPLVGQVTIDPRNFNPSIDMVVLRAAWNDKEVAFHVTWDDPTQSGADAAKKASPDVVSLQFPRKTRGARAAPTFSRADTRAPGICRR